MNKEEMNELKKRATMGDVYAMERVGLYFFNRRNPEAPFWLLKAAKAGSTWGMFLTGIMYSTGHLVKEDVRKGEKWLKKSGCYSLVKEWEKEYKEGKYKWLGF